MEAAESRDGGPRPPHSTPVEERAKPNPNPNPKPNPNPHQVSCSTRKDRGCYISILDIIQGDVDPTQVVGVGIRLGLGLGVRG